MVKRRQYRYGTAGMTIYKWRGTWNHSIDSPPGITEVFDLFHLRNMKNFPCPQMRHPLAPLKTVFLKRYQSEMFLQKRELWDWNAFEKLKPGWLCCTLPLFLRTHWPGLERARLCPSLQPLLLHTSSTTATPIVYGACNSSPANDTSNWKVLNQIMCDRHAYKSIKDLPGRKTSHFQEPNHAWEPGVCCDSCHARSLK